MAKVIGRSRHRDSAAYRQGRPNNHRFRSLAALALSLLTMAGCAPEPETRCPADTPDTCGNGSLEANEDCDPLPQPHGLWREGVTCLSVSGKLGGRLACRCCIPEDDMCFGDPVDSTAGTANQSQ